MTSLTMQHFRAAFSHLLKSRGHGAQAEMADELGMHRSLLNDILTGRKGASVRMQEKVAAYFGPTLGEMLRIGENLVHGRTPFPWSGHLEGLDKPKQLLKIVELTNEQVGHPQDNINFLLIVCKFFNGEATTSDVYTAYLKLVRGRTK